MAKKTDDIDLDDFDLDDFDFDVPDFEAEEEAANSRSPVENVLRGTVSGAKDELTNIRGLASSLKLAMPSGYGLASDSIGGFVTDARALYDNIVGDAPTLVNTSKQFGRKVMSMGGNKVLPTKVANRLNEALVETETRDVKSDAAYAQEREDAEIAQLTEIFRAKAETDEVRAKRDDKEGIERKGMEHQRFKTNVESLEAINRSLGRLVGYQDKITIKYQQKMLELNYRQVAVTKTLLDAFTISSQRQEKVLESIRHNTALPEAVKIRKSELFGLTIKQRLADGGVNSLSNWTRNYGKQVAENVRAMVGGAFGQAQGMGDMAEGVNKSHLVGRTIGGGVAGMARDFVAMQVAPLLEGNEKIARGGEKLRNKFSGIPQKINEYAQSETTGTGWKASLTDVFKRFLPQFSLDSRVGGVALQDMDQPAVYDNMARRSIIEIIPGHLADIAHWTRSIATGENVEKDVYNPVRGGFSKESEHLQDIDRQIISISERASLRGSIQEFGDKLGMERMSGEAQDALKRKLLDELANGRDLVPSRLADRDSYVGLSSEAVDQIHDLINDAFGLDFEGNRSDNSTEGLKRFNDLGDEFRQMSSMVPNIGDRIRTYKDVIGTDALRKLGYVERQGLEDRINFDTGYQNILKDPTADEAKEHAASLQREAQDKLDRDTLSPGSIYRRAKGLEPVEVVTPPSSPKGEVTHLTRAMGTSDPIPEPRVELSYEEEERRFRRRPVKLERYLGDKSTLIKIITQSRDYHAETVELLRGCCPGGSRGSLTADATSKVQSLGEKFSSTYHEYKHVPGEKATAAKARAIAEYYKLSDTVKEMREQGRDHPKIAEAEALMGKVRGELGDRAAPTMDKARSHYERFKVRGNDAFQYVGSATMAGAASIRDRMEGQGYEYNGDSRYQELYGDGLFTPKSQPKNNEGVEKKGTAKFRPRLRNLMGKFLGGKVGADVTSELTGDQDQDMLTLAIRNVQLQYETLKEVTTEKVRKGSFQDIFSRRKDGEKDGAVGDGTDAGGKYGGKGLLGTLAALFGGGDGEGGGLDLDIFGWGGGGDKEGRNERNRNRRNNRPKPKGKVGRALNAVRNFGGAALDKMGTAGQVVKGGLKGAKKLGGWGLAGLTGAAKFGWAGAKGAGRLGMSALKSPLARMAGGQVLKWGGRAALGAGALALGVAAPIVATALAVAGVVSLGVATYKFLNKETIPPLSRLRVVQYGLNPDPKSDEVKRILSLEALLEKHTTVDDKGLATVNNRSVKVEELAEIFEFDLHDDSKKALERWREIQTFMSGRFAAVYTKWVGEYHLLHKKVSLAKVDEEITGQGALDFVDRVAMADRSDVFDVRSKPFKKSQAISLDSKDVAGTVVAIKKEIAKGVDKKDKSSFKDKAMMAIPLVGQVKAIEKLTGRDLGEDAKKVLGAAVPAVGISNYLSRKLKGGKIEGTGSALGSASSMKGLLGPVVAGSLVAGILAGRSGDGVVLEKGAKLDEARSVLYRAYGLHEMEEIKVAQLATLEKLCFEVVQYDATNQAKLKSEVEIEVIKDKAINDIFNCTTVDERRRTAIWFTQRFLPIFLKYCSGVRNLARIDAKDAVDRLSTESLLLVLRGAVAVKLDDGTSVWDVFSSPWPRYALNTDPESVQAALHNLSARADSKILSEPAIISKGQVRNSKGELVDAREEEQRKSNEAKANDTARQDNNKEDEGGLFSKVKGWFKRDDKAPQQGSVSATGTQVQPASNAETLRSRVPISHPGGGTGGDVNAVPLPQGDGWDANKETLMTAANMVGVDPNLAASIAGVESNYRPNAVPYKNPKNPGQGVLSSAAGYYQVINATWKELMGKYANKYGIDPDTTQHDPRANALLGLEYVKENVDKVSKVVTDRPVSATDAYLAHFLGPSGATRFLSAPPSDSAVRHVGQNQAASNPAIFTPRGSAASVGDVYTDFDKKLSAHSKDDARQVANKVSSPNVVIPENISSEFRDDGPGSYSSSSVTAQASPPPSMVRGSSTVRPEAANDSKASDGVDLREQADQRQTSAQTRDIAVAAKAAEAQTANQARQATANVGSSDEVSSRLVGINQSQLERLTELVDLIRGGLTVKGMEGGGAANVAASTPSRQGAVNSNLKVARPAPKGTVSVSKV